MGSAISAATESGPASMMAASTASPLQAAQYGGVPRQPHR